MNRDEQIREAEKAVVKAARAVIRDSRLCAVPESMYGLGVALEKLDDITEPLTAERGEGE